MSKKKKNKKSTFSLKWLAIGYGAAMTVFILTTFVSNLVKSVNTKNSIDGGDIVEINQMVKNINSGGCGFFALRLYQRLDSTKYQIMAVGGRQHIGVYEKKTNSFIDSEGYHSLMSIQLRYQNEVRFLPEDTLIKWVANSKIWNPKFNWEDTVTINYFINRL